MKKRDRKKIISLLSVIFLSMFCFLDMVYANSNGRQEENYFNGATLTLLSGETESQMLSVVLKTSTGKLIVIDGGLEADRDKLLRTIQEGGGHVSAWLITHPHSDHIGALVSILEMEELPITIDHVYYSFFASEWYYRNEPGRAQLVDRAKEALRKLPEETRHDQLEKGQKILVEGADITVMNRPFATKTNTINNSSVAYRIIMDGRSMLFLGDLGDEGGDNLKATCEEGELRSDIVQIAHHGNKGVKKDLYRIIRPEICLWPTPEWLWNNNKGGKGIGTGPWTTLETRLWMEELGAKRNLCIKDGDQILK